MKLTVSCNATSNSFTSSHVSGDETQELLRQCMLMEDDLMRCQRIKWLMFQHEMFFEPRLGGRLRRTTVQGSEVKGNTYEVADVGENFILVVTCGMGGTLSIFLST